MGIFDILQDAFSTGPKDWSERLKESIFLTTPDGSIEFEASWRGNPMSLANKLGIHEFPGIPGARVQDLRSGAFIYPLTISFTGENNDLESSEFMQALRDQKGNWSIEHPVKGPIFVTWINATEQPQPVASGNITVIETNWIEPLPESEEESLAQQQAKAEFQASLAFDAGALSFLSIIQDTVGQVQSMILAVGSAITSVKKFLTLVENFEILGPQILAIEAAINSTLEGDIIDTTALAGQMQQLVRIFGLGQVDATNSILMYLNFADEIIKDVPTQANDEGLAKMSVVELMALSAVASASEMALIGGFTSRPQLITTINKLFEIQENVTNALDEVQEIYSESSINKRYFSQLDTYKTTFISVAQSTQFLLLSLFGLPSERRIILKKDTFTPQVAKDEYGNIGTETDELSNIDLLISSNNLMGNEIYILPEGKEILIYQ